MEVERLAYRQRGQENLHPADALLNLPKERHSHGLRRWAAIEASRGSFDSAKDAIARATRQGMGKRQIESLVGLAASDVDAFYAERSAPGCDPGDVLVLCVDGKGIVMRPEALREATRRAAQGSSTKLKTRLSKGESVGASEWLSWVRSMTLRQFLATLPTSLPSRTKSRSQGRAPRISG